MFELAQFGADLDRLLMLTLGDFAAVERRIKITGPLSPAAYIEALANECSFKRQQQSKAIGFLAN
jgi:hypothetical protein